MGMQKKILKAKLIHFISCSVERHFFEKKMNE
jgi:hypothetical protein